MRHIFDCEGIASEKTQKKCMTKVTELALSLPKGYFYTISVNGSLDRRRRVNVGGTYFDLDFYIWNLDGKQVCSYTFEDSDGTLWWNEVYYQIKKTIENLPIVEE